MPEPSNMSYSPSDTLAVTTTKSNTFHPSWKYACQALVAERSERAATKQGRGRGERGGAPLGNRCSPTVSHVHTEKGGGREEGRGRERKGEEGRGRKGDRHKTHKTHTLDNAADLDAETEHLHNDLSDKKRREDPLKVSFALRVGACVRVCETVRRRRAKEEGQHKLLPCKQGSSFTAVPDKNTQLSYLTQHSTAAQQHATAHTATHFDIAVRVGTRCLDNDVDEVGKDNHVDEDVKVAVRHVGPQL